MSLEKLTKAELVTKITELEGALAKAKEANTSEDLKAALAENEELRALVTELNRRNRNLTATKGNKNPLVEAGGKAIQIICGVRVDGKEYSPAELATNPALCLKLLAEGSIAVQEAATV